MTTGATGQLGLALPVQGELSGTWGDTVNNGITQYTNIAIAGTLTLTGDGAVTLANTTGDASASNITSTLAGAGTVTAQFAIVKVSGTTTTKVVTGPSYSKTYVVDNASSFAVTFKASGQTGVSVAAAEKVTVVFNGTDYIKLAGTIANAAGSNTQIQFNNGGLFGASSSLTWDGTTLSSTQVNITGQGTLRLQDTTGGEYVGLRSPSALGASYTLTFPADDGTNGQALITDGSGGLSWSTAASGDVYGPGSSTDNAVARFDSTTGKLLQNSVVIVGDTGDVSGVGTLSATTLTLTNALGTAYGGTGLTSFTSGGVVYASSTSALATSSAFQFNGTDLGLGVTPSVNTVSGSGYRQIEVGTSAGNMVFAGGNELLVVQNAIYNSGFKYAQSTQASYFRLNAGEHQFFTAPSGTAGNAVTFTQRMTLDANGRLGIGTTSVGARLDISYAGGTSSNTTLGLKIGADVGDNTSRTVNTRKFASIGGANYSNSAYNIGILHCDSDSTTSKIIIGGGSSGVYDATEIRFVTATTTTSTAGLERMTITSAGDVGIGTSSPDHKLDISGSLCVDAFASPANNYITLRNSISPSSAGGLGFKAVDLGSGNDDGLGLYGHQGMIFYSAQTERMRITSAGNVGIGTSSPAAKLHVVSSGQQMAAEPSLGSGDTSIMVGRGFTLSGTAATVGTKSFINCAFEGSDDSAYSAFGYITTAVGTRSQIATNFYIETKSAGASAPAERARIDSVGNLLVGTTNLNGAVANNRAIVGGGFHSLNGELTTLASGTAYTMFTAPADFATYLVNVHGGASAAIYSETAIVQINNTSVRVDIISDGPTVVIDNSGLAIRATQNSGNTMGYLIWSAVRMA
tara:strand:+ start:127 stop:2703 length:2577 start_codon:yes stop_codon:yes gene_type:complete